MEKPYKFIGLAIVAAVIAVGAFMFANPDTSATPVAPNTSSNSIKHTDAPIPQVAGASTINESKPELAMPISIGLVRVSKKPFGLKVTPETSPVENDIFSGYHTGLDFETFATEQDKDVVITAACDGAVRVKTWAKGYGGLLVQSCKLDGQDVTVIYGHMNVDSISAKVGQVLSAGDTIGNLGQGNSHETDGRRKHLHFDIHKGSEINILGYVPKQDDLAEWIDPEPYLK